MKILLMDLNAENVRFWQQSAVEKGIQLDYCQQWAPSRDLTPWRVIVVDQSVVPSHDYGTRICELSLQNPTQLVVATGGNLSVHQVVQIMSSGVMHVLESPFDREEFQPLFQSVVEQATHIQTMHAEFDRLRALFGQLTQREIDVLEHVLKGIPNKQTAENLKVSVRTIEARRAKLYSKTESGNVVDLVRKVDRLDELERNFSVPSPEEPQQTTPPDYPGRRPLSLPLSSDCPSENSPQGQKRLNSPPSSADSIEQLPEKTACRKRLVFARKCLKEPVEWNQDARNGFQSFDLTLSAVADIVALCKLSL